MSGPGDSFGDAFVRELLASLVRIRSINPRFCGPRSGASDEREIAGFLRERLDGMGLETRVVETTEETEASGRPSVVATLRGRGGGDARSLMLNGHLDTVGIETMEDPFSACVEGGRLYGRGSYDMKGGVAACVAAIHRVQERGVRLRGDVVLTAVADEEDASLGTQAVLADPKIAERIATGRFVAVVTEPTGLDLAVAHRGFAWIRARTKGFACHGSLPERGIDANRHMGRVIQAIEQLDVERLDQPEHPLLGRPSLHIGRIEGGLGPSIYSPSCELTLELRTFPGETGEGLLRRLDELVEPARREVPGFQAELDLEIERPPLEGDPEGAFTREVQTSMAAVLGAEPPATGLSFWTDAALIEQTGIPTVLLGPDGQGAHEDVEWVDLASVERVAAVLERVILEVCG